ncbi:hypothetical protein Ancab_040529 [Ancistrocladus abbreviatus]
MLGWFSGMEVWLGEMGFTCIQMALSDFYASHADYRTRLALHTRDSNQDVVVLLQLVLSLSLSPFSPSPPTTTRPAIQNFNLELPMHTLQSSGKVTRQND